MIPNLDNPAEAVAAIGRGLAAFRATIDRADLVQVEAESILIQMHSHMMRAVEIAELGAALTAEAHRINAEMAALGQRLARVGASAAGAPAEPQ